MGIRQNETTPLKGSLAVSLKLNIMLPYKLATIHIGFHSTDFASNVYAKICTPMFIEAYYCSDANNRGHWVRVDGNSVLFLNLSVNLQLFKIFVY